VAGDLDMTSVNAAKQARIRWSAGESEDLPTTPRLVLTDARFGAGVIVAWGPGELVLHRARLGGSSVIDRDPTSPAPPSLSSALNLDAAELALRDVDISRTLFAGAQNLGKVSELDPDRLPQFQRNPLMVRRPILFDELVYRGLAWDARVDDPEQTLPRSPARLEQSYQSLRKALEDAGDVPAANELYFAERYWRRKRLSWPRKVPLTVYEVISGHGVRPLRALAALAVLLVGAALLFDSGNDLSRRLTVGKTGTDVATLCASRPPVTTIDAQSTVSCTADFSESLEYAVRSASAFLRPTTAFELDGTAVFVDVVLRIGAPALFALFVLSLRSRVVR
jgi:hypothetical protein